MAAESAEYWPLRPPSYANEEWHTIYEMYLEEEKRERREALAHALRNRLMSMKVVSTCLLCAFVVLALRLALATFTFNTGDKLHTRT